MKTPDLMSGLPGEALVRRGLADARAGRRTPAACLVQMARPRLVASGLLSEENSRLMDEPERELYRLLCEENGDAYGRYNALMRELVSFQMALDRRTKRN